MMTPVEMSTGMQLVKKLQAHLVLADFQQENENFQGAGETPRKDTAQLVGAAGPRRNHRRRKAKRHRLRKAEAAKQAQV
jgi:hypothetical protein